MMTPRFRASPSRGRRLMAATFSISSRLVPRCHEGAPRHLSRPAFPNDIRDELLPVRRRFEPWSPDERRGDPVTVFPWNAIRTMDPRERGA